MISIYKYRLPDPDLKIQTVKLPEVFTPLSVGTQRNPNSYDWEPKGLYLWATVNTNSEEVERQILVVGTGWDLTKLYKQMKDEKVFGEHLGTVQDGDYVWHVFKVGEW